MITRPTSWPHRGASGHLSSMRDRWPNLFFHPSSVLILWTCHLSLVFDF
uniref:Uncharacterized protein n=1 Tax=Anguilla anguilla TaxID=7936 RepID=A0A0E9V2A0_ANGAN